MSQGDFLWGTTPFIPHCAPIDAAMSRSGLGQNACAERPAAEPRPLRENSSFETGRKKATKAGFTPDALRNFCQKDFFLAVHHSFLTLSSLEFAENI